MQEELQIDYTDENKDYTQLLGEKDFYTPEEAYELVMSDVQSIYDLKDAV